MTARIWYLIGALSPGGTSLTLVDLASGLDHDQFDVTIWTLLDEMELAEELDPAVEVRTLDASGKADVTALARFLGRARRADPDIIQSFLFFDNIVARMASTVTSSTIVTGVRAVPNDQPTHRALADRLTLGLSDHVVSNSSAGKRFAVERGAAPEAVSVIHNGRDPAEYGEATPAPHLRSSFGIPAEAPLVGTVGRLIERKGVYDVLAAWPEIREHTPDAHFLFVGDGPEAEALRREVASRGMAESVHFAGHRDDVPAVLASMDLFVFPSHFEGLPGAVIEAMAAGVPIVASAVDGNVELIEDGETGLLVPPRDPEALAETVETLLAEPERAKRYGAAARERMVSRFSTSHMIREFESLYTTLLAT